MKKLFIRSLLFCIFVTNIFLVYSDENTEQKSQDTQTRAIRLNNFPISIFTPQTQQFAPSISNISKAVTGPTGATGPIDPCLLNFAMLRRTQSFPGGDLFSGETGQFDEGLLYRITSNPTGSPSFGTPSESLTIQIDGYYLIELSYAGDQLENNPTQTDFYATFNLLVNGATAKQIILSTFGVRQIWQHIIWLTGGDVVSIQAGSDISFISSPTGIGPIDGLILTMNWIGPCLTPT